MTLTQLKLKLRHLSSLHTVYLILGIIALLLFYLYFRPKLYEITHTFPADLTPNISLNSTLIFYFDQPLPNTESINVQLTPPILGHITYTSDRTQAIFTPQAYYQPNTTYQVTASGPQVKKYDFKFTSKTRGGFPIQETPTDSDTPQANNRNNLISTLPYRTPQFNIEYLAPSNSLIITIKELPIEIAQQAAFDYIALFGITNAQKIFNLSIETTPDLVPRADIINPPASSSANPTTQIQ